MSISQFNPEDIVRMKDGLIKKSSEIAKAYDHADVTTDHLFMAVVSDFGDDYEGWANHLIKNRQLDIRAVERSVDAYLKDANANGFKLLSENKSDGDDTDNSNDVMNSILGMFHDPRVDEPKDIVAEPELSKQFNDALTQAIESAANHSIDMVDFGFYFLSAIAVEPSHTKDQLDGLGNFTPASLTDDADATTGEEPQTPLQRYCVNLNDLANLGKIDPVIGRDHDTSRLVVALSRRNKANAIIVGKAGSGKTAIVEGLARDIVGGRVPNQIKDFVIYSLNVNDVVSGTKYRGEFEQRMKGIIDELVAIKEKGVSDPVLWIDEIHMIMGAGGGEGDTSMANILKPALARSGLRCIGATTLPEYRKLFEKDKALSRRFYKLEVDEPDRDTTVAILKGIKDQYEKFHNVVYTDAAIEAVVDLSIKYIHNRALPDKAIDIMDLTAARKKLANFRKIDIAEIEEEVSNATKVPVDVIRKKEGDRLRTLSENIKQNVFGQDQAIDKLTDAIMLSRAGIREDNKPSGAFLFLGTSGCGKTEVAVQLAKNLGVELVRFDMSEYMDSFSSSKLIGSPPGYVGYGDGENGSGALVTAIESNPNCVLLLDEIEKAHPSILNLFLQVLDDSTLKSSDGRIVKFNNVTIIFTSNAGARESGRSAIGLIDSGSNDVKASRVAERFFAPEFINRLDAMLSFNNLTPSIMGLIVKKYLTYIQSRVESRDIKLELDDDATEWLCVNGFDSKLGARPLKRLMNEKIGQPLAKSILFNDTKGVTLKVTLKDNELQLA